jgi:hypothetical protein
MTSAQKPPGFIQVPNKQVSWPTNYTSCLLDILLLCARHTNTFSHNKFHNSANTITEL